ncbi:MAG: (Fe-S)-binding protein [Chloroflexota bacterium]|nr:(Fe-S)-binding protein [Chloroflexota bacterium]
MSSIEQEIRDTRASLCLDCGKCTVVCPVAQFDSSFNPRLIVQRRLGPDGSAGDDDSVWSCVSCYMCTERCNYHVRFPEFIQAMRSEALENGAELQCAHGGTMQALMHMMADGNVQQDRLGWLPQDVEVASGCGTVFFVGCAPYFDVVFSDLGVNTLEGVKGALRLLNRAGIPFDLLANERCCGRDLLLQGDREGFAALARANMEEFSRQGVKRVITGCPEGCHTMRVDYPRVLGAVGVEVLHVTEVIAPLVESGELRLGGMEKKVTYHDPCTLGRCLRVFDQPRQVLEGIAGVEVVEMEQSREKALCCGSSPWAFCGVVNRQIQEQRLAQAGATGAEVLVTACPKCQIHLKCAQRSGDGEGTGMEIQDLASLAAGSLD